MNINNWVGASSEYRLAAAFLERGVQVYWPSMQQQEVDFIIEEDDEMVRVQVKTARKRHGKYNARVWRTVAERPAVLAFDELAVVAPDGHVWALRASDIVSTSVTLSIGDKYYAGNIND